MTAETRLAAARIEEREAFRTLCVCGHPLAWHSRVREKACIPMRGGRCKCLGFEESTNKEKTNASV